MNLWLSGTANELTVDQWSISVLVIEKSIKRAILLVSLINTCKFDREHLSFVRHKDKAKGRQYRLNEQKWLITH